MKKSTIRTGKHPKKFRILRAYSILSYAYPSIVREFFIAKYCYLMLFSYSFRIVSAVR